MDERTKLEERLRVTHELVRHNVSDISDAEASRIVSEGLAPVVWQITARARQDRSHR
jgi:hypothetical protein